MPATPPPALRLPGSPVTDPLAEARQQLIETAAHSGTWQWEAATDRFALSPTLAARLPRLPLLPVPRAPGTPAPTLPGALAQVLALAAGPDRTALAPRVAAALEHRASFEVNHLLATDDVPLPVRHVGSVVQDDGRVLGMVGALTLLPQTGQVDPDGDAEVAARYRQLVKVLPSMVVIHQDGLIVSVNPAVEAVFGGEDVAATLLGKPIMDFIVPEGRQRMMARVLAMSDDGAIAPAEEEQLLLPDGRVIPVETVSIRTTWRGRPAGQAVLTDIRDRKAVLARLAHEATHDMLTGLGNRRLILEELDRRLAAGQPFGVLFVDLDRFKEVNDSYGHALGDEVLQQAVDRLTACAERWPGTFLGRLSGDEFVLVTSEATDGGQLAGSICEAMSAPFLVGSWELVVTASVGVLTAAPAEGVPQTAYDLIRDADVAMYRAKQDGRNRWTTFDERMRTGLQRRVTLTDYLRRTVDGTGLSLLFQPIVDARTGRPDAVETLVRWTDPVLGPVYPDEFIPLAEETGLIVPLGRWVLTTACRQVARWRSTHPQLAGLRVAVNLSPRQLSDPALVELVRDTLAATGLPAAALCLEITETALAEDAAAAEATVTALHDLGVHLSIDDFGTGYSSIAYLRNLPVDELKVDRSFVSGLGDDVRDGTICASVVSMAHLLGLSVVAEGIETAKQLQYLQDLSCDYVQGYHLCRPQAPDEVMAYLLRA